MLGKEDDPFLLRPGNCHVKLREGISFYYNSKIVVLSCQSSVRTHFTHMSKVLAHRSSFCAKPALSGQRGAQVPRGDSPTYILGSKGSRATKNHLVCIKTYLGAQKDYQPSVVLDFRKNQQIFVEVHWGLFFHI